MATNGQAPQMSRQGLFASLTKDLVSVVSLGLLLFGIHHFATPFTRGFQCDDETIRYPYKDSTVSSGLCYFLGSGINVALILLLEYVNLLNADHANDGHSQTSSQGFQYRLYVRNVYCRLVVWFFGSITSELLTDITKVTAGRLRPHFISVCKPRIFNGSIQMDLDEYCQQTKNPYEYITNYECQGNPKKLRDTRLSFLSGHSSYSAYSAVHAVLYIQSAIDIKKLGLIKPSIQILIISMALYTGLSRVSDYKHHWQDVLAGLVLGTTVASAVSVYLWPALYRTYVKLMKTSSQQLRASEAGEELNRFSY